MHDAIQDLYPDDFAHCFGCGKSNAEGHRLIVACGSPQERAQVVRRLVLAGIDVHEVMPFGRDLEQVFFDLVGDA